MITTDTKINRLQNWLAEGEPRKPKWPRYLCSTDQFLPENHPKRRTLHMGYSVYYGYVNNGDDHSGLGAITNVGRNRWITDDFEEFCSLKDAKTYLFGRWSSGVEGPAIKNRRDMLVEDPFALMHWVPIVEDPSIHVTSSQAYKYALYFDKSVTGLLALLEDSNSGARECLRLSEDHVTEIGRRLRGN